MILLPLQPVPLVHPRSVIAIMCQLRGGVVIWKIRDQALPCARHGVDTHIENQQEQDAALSPIDKPKDGASLRGRSHANGTRRLRVSFRRPVSWYLFRSHISGSLPGTPFPY